MKVTKQLIRSNEIDFEKLRQNCFLSFTKIVKDNHEWRSDDARRWLLSRLSTILFMATLNLYIESQYLTDDDFWIKYLSVGDLKTTAKEGLEYYDRSARSSLVIDSVASLEHSFKIILKEAHLLPKNPSFYNLFKKVVEITHAELDRAQAEIPFRLLRLIRNCHHNSWIHKPEDSRDREVRIKYKGEEYIFEEGKMPMFVSWDLLHKIIEHILIINKLLIMHPEISKIKHIKDPGAMETIQV